MMARIQLIDHTSGSDTERQDISARRLSHKKWPSQNDVESVLKPTENLHEAGTKNLGLDHDATLPPKSSEARSRF